MAMCSILPLSTNSVVSVSCSVFLSSSSAGECSSYSVKLGFNYLRSNLFSVVRLFFTQLSDFFGSA